MSESSTLNQQTLYEIRHCSSAPMYLSTRDGIMYSSVFGKKTQQAKINSDLCTLADVTELLPSDHRQDGSYLFHTGFCHWSLTNMVVMTEELQCNLSCLKKDFTNSFLNFLLTQHLLFQAVLVQTTLRCGEILPAQAENTLSLKTDCSC